MDTTGLLLAVVVYAANLDDRAKLKEVLNQAKESGIQLKKIWADQGYVSEELKEEVQSKYQIELEVVKHPWDGQRKVFVAEGEPTPVMEKAKGFHVLPRRWVVERTFAWGGRDRRLSKDYEYLTETSEAMFRGAMIHLMVRRLSNKKRINSFDSS